MNPWAVLDITPVNDARAIKRAYAKKLKQTRPDEKPEEFQVLHSAYRQALQLAEQLQEEEEADVELESSNLGLSSSELSSESLPLEAEDPIVSTARVDQAEDDTNDTLAVEKAESLSKPEPSVSIEEKEGGRTESSVQSEAAIPISEEQAVSKQERDLRIEEYRRVLKQVDVILSSDAELNDERRWYFLGKSSHMLDEEYNWNLGLSIFDRFARLNQSGQEKEEEKKPKRMVSVNVLQYCDSLFDWRGNAPYLYQSLDEKLCDSLFGIMENHESEIDPLQGLRGGREVIRANSEELVENYEQYYFGHLLARGIAVVLDLLLLYVVIGFPTSIVFMAALDRPESEATLQAGGICIIAYLFFTWILDSSRFQGTPGKYLMGYRVTNRNFKRIGYGHGLWRVVSFVLCLALGKIGWFINCFLGGNLIHDRLSRSHVVNMRKTREEYLRR
ncbi:RDD family protein [Microbulbifer sp. SSSA008]|uniref:RDD family protein n=1 Tax=Microbulbifer sp. SSSA008 TaxID=3243380 RepID=UPI00403A6F58